MRENLSSRRRPPWTWVVAVCVCLTIVVVFGVRHFVMAPFHVPSESMTPTLNAGDVILVDRTKAGTAERFGVVVFDGTGYFAPGADASSSRYWVKRVIGVGGDRVRCCTSEGQITVNGSPISEPYLAPGVKPSLTPFDVEVPRSRIFVLGDNRAHSGDSLDHLGHPGGGMIPLERVQGPVTRVVWPLQEWRSLREYNDQ